MCKWTHAVYTCVVQGPTGVERKSMFTMFRSGNNKPEKVSYKNRVAEIIASFQNVS